MTYDVPKNMGVPVAISKPNDTDVASPDMIIGPAIAISIPDEGGAFLVTVVVVCAN